MKAIFQKAWHRFNLVATIVGEVQGYIISTVFYFTLLVPFALIAKTFTDPLKVKSSLKTWHSRPPVPVDLESARDQG